jgi:hypothetical protein
MAMTPMMMQTMANELNISETAFFMDTIKQNNSSNNNNLISITMKFPIVVIFYFVSEIIKTCVGNDRALHSISMTITMKKCAGQIIDK